MKLDTRTQSIFNCLTAQRNDAQNLVSELSGEITCLNETIAELRAHIDTLDKQILNLRAKDALDISTTAN